MYVALRFSVMYAMASFIELAGAPSQAKGMAALDASAEARAGQATSAREAHPSTLQDTYSGGVCVPLC